MKLAMENQVFPLWQYQVIKLFVTFSNGISGWRRKNNEVSVVTINHQDQLVFTYFKTKAE